MIKKVVIIISLLLILSLSVIFFVFVLGREQIRAKNMYISLMLQDTRIFIIKYYNENNILPKELPEELNEINWLKNGILSLADPYSDKIKYTNKISVKVEYNEPLPRFGENFKFKGSKIKYIKLSDKVAVIYSLGPDRDDDFKKLNFSEIEKFMKTKLKGTGWCIPDGRVVYDPPSGNYSNGDIILFIFCEEWDEKISYSEYLDNLLD